jgi:recombination protein RecT
MTTSEPKAVAKKPIDTFRDLLERLKPQIAMALPKHIDINRMIRICLTTIQRTPKLLECTQESLLGCLFQCVQLGLEPDGLLGHAYLVPYGKACTLIVGYKGLLKLARQSDEVESISARVVCEKDVFEYEFGLDEKLIHKPSHEEDPGPITFVYAIFRLKGGGHHMDVMSVGEVERIRERSKAGKDGPWVTDWAEMAKKTVLRRASKMAPASIEDLARAVAIDSRSEAGIPPSLDIDMPSLPAADVPGIDQQGKRLSLGKKAPIDVPPENGAADPGAAISPGPGKAATPTAPPAATTGEAKAEPPKEFVMSTSKQRTQIAKDATAANIGLHEINERYNVQSFGELSHEQAEDALAWIRGITGEVEEPGAEG